MDEAILNDLLYGSKKSYTLKEGCNYIWLQFRRGLITYQEMDDTKATYIWYKTHKNDITLSGGYRY